MFHCYKSLSAALLHGSISHLLPPYVPYKTTLRCIFGLKLSFTYAATIFGHISDPPPHTHTHARVLSLLLSLLHEAAAAVPWSSSWRRPPGPAEHPRCFDSLMLPASGPPSAAMTHAVSLNRSKNGGLV